MSDDLAEALAAALKRRLADIEAADDRRRSFVLEPGGPPPDASPAGDEASVMRDLVLRAMACAADPVNYAMLRRAVTTDVTVSELAEGSALGRLAVSERVNDLLQLGLVARSPTSDAVAATPAGIALVDLVERVAAGAERQRTAG